MRLSNRMSRRAFLKALGAGAALLPILPHRLWAAGTGFTRRRPSDPSWPSKAAWKQLGEQVGGKLIPVEFPLSVIEKDPTSRTARRIWKNLKNPYYIGDEPGLVHTLGWVDGWLCKPSVYAVAARNAQDIAAAVNFARENDLRLVVKGGGHSYQGTSDAPDSLLIWTWNMRDIEMHPAFVPQGCSGTVPAHPAVTMGAGTIDIQAYDAVTTKGGKYVQGGGCLTVGMVGLLLGGGFGSFSKRYGTAASGLLQAEVVTADGQIRIANACTNPDLFWALKGGGGGSFGVVSKVTLLTHELPGFIGTANFKIKAASDDAYRRLIREFISFYHDNLFNEHWGEQAHFHPDNTLAIRMVSCGLDTEQIQKVWKPFLDWVAQSPHDYSHQGHTTIASLPARRMWDVEWQKKHWPELILPNPNHNPLITLADDAIDLVPWNPLFDTDDRPGASPNNVWWKGDGGQCGWFIWAFESVWLPKSLLESSAQKSLADAFFASSRYAGFELHFNKGLAGGPSEALARSRDTSTNPAVLDAFALVIAGDGQGPAYPGIPGHEPSLTDGRNARTRVHLCMNELRALVPNPGAYCSESDYFQQGFQQAYWGSNYSRLAQIKKKYDPDGLFFVHNGVGSEEWSRDGFTRLFRSVITSGFE